MMHNQNVYMEGDISDASRIGAASAITLGGLLQLTPDLVARLRDCRRAEVGLSRVIANRLGVPAATTISQQVLLRMNAQDLLELARHAGAVRHAHAVLGLLDGDRLRDFCLRAGNAAREAALRWNGLVAGAPILPVLGALEDVVEQEGQACLRAWARQQPPAIGWRLELSLPPGEARDGSEAALAAHIVEQLAGDMAAGQAHV